MANTFKIATFNCENLFSRPRALNRLDKKVGKEIMEKKLALDEELDKDVYDGPKILAMYKDKALSGFIELKEFRGKLFSNSRTKGLIMKAKGKDDWDGFIDYKRDTFNDAARENTAKVINTINTDIISLIEVEDKTTLDMFNSKVIGAKPNKPYPYTMLIDAFDKRRIDVSLLSRFEFGDIRTHMFEKKGNSYIFSRDCLEVKVKLAENDFIYFLVNHFKSQGYGKQADNDARRLGQTQRVAAIIKEKFDLQHDKVVVLGDFNASPDSPTVAPIVKMAGLKDVLEFKIPNDKQRVTYFYNKWEQIDYILVSKPLQDKCVAAGVERKGIFNLEKNTKNYPEIREKAWPEVQIDKGIASASDHGAVWAEFSY